MIPIRNSFGSWSKVRLWVRPHSFHFAYRKQKSTSLSLYLHWEKNPLGSQAGKTAPIRRTSIRGTGVSLGNMGGPIQDPNGTPCTSQHIIVLRGLRVEGSWWHPHYALANFIFFSSLAMSWKKWKIKFFIFAFFYFLSYDRLFSLY